MHGLSELKYQIERLTSAELKLDETIKTLYSTDASIYQILPLGVAFPKTDSDLVGIVELAAANNIPILPRGAGSSLAGQAVGEAVIIDCSRYLNQVLEIDAAENRALVQPGLILANLNKATSKFGLSFGPDPASGDRATFGGMLGNNSTGAHSILYGMTADHIISIDAIMADGSEANFNMIADDEAVLKSEKNTLEGELYKSSIQIKERLANELDRNWPHVWRRASGYNLNYLTGWSKSKPPQWQGSSFGTMYPPVLPDHMNMAGLLVGSEGTLVVYKQAWVNLVPVPEKKILAILSYDSVASACEATLSLLNLQPSAVELLPRALIERARAIPAYAGKLNFVEGNPAALLLVEFSGDNLGLLEEKAGELGRSALVVSSPQQQAEIWAVRKVGLGLLMSVKGDAKPLPFVEDVAVPVERLGEFVKEFEKITTSFGTHGDFYAHASAGCLHIRPLVNLKQKSGIDAMRGITEEVVKLAVRLGGALSGEHGDGLARSEWMNHQFGSDLMGSFHEIKQAADPQNLLNPKNLLNAPSMTENLRYGEDYQTTTWQPILNFEDGLSGAIEMCNGAGVCRHDSGFMCPTFQVTRDEMHVTRGRANLLRAMLSDRFSLEDKGESAVFEALDLCIECKACKAECPSAVDMAKLKYEFLNFYYQDHRRPLRDYLFANIGQIASLIRPVAPLMNFLIRNKYASWMGEKFLGISRDRSLPKFRIKRYKYQIQASNKEEIILLVDPFSEYFYPELVEAALRLLAGINCKVNIVPITGAGRTLISKGFLNKAKDHAQKVVESLKDIDPEGKMCIVGIEPSDIYTLKDEYLDFFPGSKSVQNIANRTYMLDEFLVRSVEHDSPRFNNLGNILEGKVILLHGHCYQKAQPPASDLLPVGSAATESLLAGLGAEVEVVDSGCCGMAGAFGYESEHYQLSVDIGEQKLFPAIRLATDKIILAAGVSCRTHIEAGTHKEVMHPVELIASCF